MPSKRCSSWIVQIPEKGLSLTLTSAKSKSHACRLAFAYWIREGQLKSQPKTDPNYLSSFAGVNVIPA